MEPEGSSKLSLSPRAVPLPAAPAVVEVSEKAIQTEGDDGEREVAGVQTEPW